MSVQYPTNYNEAREIFETTRRRKIANNTYLERRHLGGAQASYAVRLHSTDVVTFHPNGTVKLDSGGWHTVTTKERINRVLRSNGMGLWQTKFKWSLGGCGLGADFTDGIVIDLFAHEVKH